MSKRVMCLILCTWAFGLSTVQAQRVEWVRAAYWDVRYPTGWIDEALSVMYRDGLAAAGYEILNADQLKTWMEARIADGKPSVVVFCKDNYPDTVLEPMTTCPLRRYLQAGGKAVVMADIPFYNEGHVGMARTNWANNGAPNILGFDTSPTTGGVARGRNQMVTLTAEAANWGMTKTWLSNRPASPTGTPNMTILATDNIGSAAAWVQHWLEGDTYRGFVRIWDVDLTLANFPPVEEIIRIAEFDGGPKAMPIGPTDGAIWDTQLLQWAGGPKTVFRRVFVGADRAAVEAADMTSPEFKEEKPAQQAFYVSPTLWDAGVTYYWRVDLVDALGVTWKGDVWSFTTPAAAASAPVPADGATYVADDVTLEWMAGMNVMTHDIYFSADRAAVEAGAAEVKRADKQLEVSYTPAALEPGVTYYWRVDEVVDAATIPGQVWSFTVQPVIAKTDPSMIGWWTMDNEGAGKAVDHSGYNNHGVLEGGPKWVEGYFGDALFLDGVNDGVNCGASEVFNFSGSVSIAAWVKPIAASADGKIASNQNNSTGGYKLGIYQNKAEMEIRTSANAAHLNRSVAGGTILTPGEWYHVTGTYVEGQFLRTYVNGTLDREAATAEILGASNGAFYIGRESYSAAYFLCGLIDDVRLYNRALSDEEIAQLVAGDPLAVSNRQPARDDTVNVFDATELSWSAGAGATAHDVYFGTDRDAVKAAVIGSAEYKGRQDTTSFNLAGLVAFDGGEYFWRIDEVAANGSIHTGDVWRFIVPGFVLVDDFEDYTNTSPTRMFQTWLDTYGYSADEFFPTDYLGNGTGAGVGHDIWTEGTTFTTIAEKNTRIGGIQSMPLYYDNAAADKKHYSETERAWATPQDFTAGGCTDLSLWFKGRAVRFMEKTPGHYTISSTSGDISSTANDHFRFVYKTLNGDGMIVAKIDSLWATHEWSKSGVMIRETMEQNSVRAHMVATGVGRRAFETRPTTGGASVSTNNPRGSVTFPFWVKLERKGNEFTASFSQDGVNWELQAGDADCANPQTIAMGASVYIGMCVTSNNLGWPTIAEFSDVAVTGSVSDGWMIAEVGAAGSVNPANDAADLYVALQDNSGNVGVATLPDGTIVSNWTQWTVPLSQFTGVNASAITRMFIGVGNRNNPQADGTGLVYIDDIRVIKPTQ